VVEDVLRKLGDAKGSAPASPAPPPKSEKPPSAPVPKTKAPVPSGDGVFADAAEAAEAAAKAQKELSAKGVAARAKVVEIVKALCTEKAKEWGKLELDETKIGRLDHKVEKLEIVKLVPGTEWFRPYALSGDHGITLEEYAPFGVIGAITPSTHSIPTLAGNVVNIVAAGNAVVFNPHPGASRCAAEAVRVFNRAIERETGIRNLVTTIGEPSLESFDAICQAEPIRLLAVTGGPGVVAAAMKSGKRSVCAGPGNPPVVVDETADLAKAAGAIIAGAAYDNNLLCIGEKAVFVVEDVADVFLREMKRAGAVLLNDGQVKALTEAMFTFKEGEGAGCSPHPVLKRDLVGKDVKVLAGAAGATVSGDTSLLIAETPADHPLVLEEQMAPILPVVRVRDFEEGVRLAKQAEHGYKHSAMIFSQNVARMTYMARELETTLFVKNGPSVAGLGLGGEGYLSYSIATTTGEGITNPQTFTRVRRCVMVDNLRIH
jgi:aldehyde dehydrogenase